MSELSKYEKEFIDVLLEEPSKITLLYQLSLISSELNHERLFALIKDAANKSIEKNYPVSFSYFLVLIGINDYKGGEYWSSIWKELNLPTTNINRQTHWGNLFLSVLKEYKLPEFEDERSHKYVTPILGHGGIPTYCLPDFFEKLLLPIINGEIGSASTSIEEILQEWKLHSSLYMTADKPVYRFLLHGGKVANDFLSRCIQVAQDIIDGNDLDESFEHSQIPERVIEEFKEWYAKSKDRVKKTTVQIKPPKIVFDEIEIKIKCLIPEQSLPEDCKSPTYELYTDNKPITSQKVKSYRYSNKTIIDETEFILPPANKYSVRLINNNLPIRQWEFVGLRDESSWMAFFDDHDRSIIKKEMLPRSSLWLVYNHTLKINATNSIIEEPVFLTRQWKDFKFVRINTESSNDISLLNSAGEPTLLPLSSSKEPYLDKDSLPGLDLDGYPMFTETLPSIYIPFDKSEDLLQWIVTIKTIRKQQNIKRVFRLSDICHIVNQSEAVINLSDNLLIGEMPFGIFNIRLRGRLGNDKEFTFGFIKQFDYAHEKRAFFMADESPIILIETIPDISFLPTECCKILKQENGYYETLVEEGVVRATLEVLHDESNFMLSFEIPRLMWKIQGLENDKHLGWHSDEFEIPIDDLQSNQDMSLIIRANLNDGERCSLQIKESDHEEEKSFRMGRVKFDLTPFTDSISGAGLPIVSLLLKFNNPTYFDANRCILKVRTEWTIEHDTFSFLDEINGDRRMLCIDWKEKKPVKNRILRLWDCSRPWKEPREYQIEDGKKEIIIEEKLDVLPSGSYRAEFTVVNEWAVDNTPKTLPADGDFNVFSISLSGNVAGLTDAFESYLIDTLSKKAACLFTMPETVEDAKRLCSTLFYLFREGYISSKEGCLELCCDLWTGIATGNCKPFIKKELINLTKQIENLLPFKKGEMLIWQGKKLGQKLLKNRTCDGIIVQFDGIEDGKIHLAFENNSIVRTKLLDLNKLNVAPPNAKIGLWRKKKK